MVNCVAFGVLAILAVVNGATILDEYSEGIPVPTPAARSLLSRAAFDCATDDSSGNFCDEDCKTLVTCVAGTSINTAACAGTTPFCKKGAKACSATAEGCAEISLDAFACTDKGFFPNINNCASYYQCTAKGSPAQQYKCADGFNYYPEGKNCKRGATCFKIDCAVKANLNQMVVYKPDPNVYVFCVADAKGVPQAHVLKCKNDYLYVAPDGCQFACRAEGRVADPINPAAFYDCYRSGTGYKFLHQTCLTGTAYDAKEGYCVEKTPTDQCTPGVVTTNADGTCSECSATFIAEPITCPESFV